MSIISKKSSGATSSILRDHSTSNRNRLIQEQRNKVRFSLNVNQSLSDVLNCVEQNGNVIAYDEYINMLNTTALPDDTFRTLIVECKECIPMLQPKYVRLVETLLSLSWMARPQHVVDEYKAFVVELLVTHNKYTRFAVNKLIQSWLPEESASAKWVSGTPNGEMLAQLTNSHEIVNKIIELIPMATSIVLKSIDSSFPYHKKPAFVTAGYLHNVFWFLEYQPIFTEDLFRMVLEKLLLLDVNASREEIELAEEKPDPAQDEIFEFEGMEVGNSNPQTVFDEDAEEEESLEMAHPVAEALDMCLVKLYQFIAKEYKNEVASEPTASNSGGEKYFKMLVNAFEAVILPAHNPHHVQFFIFYVCGFKETFLEYFLSTLWAKVSNHNVPAVTRQAAVCYMSSLLARSKPVSLGLLQGFLQEMCQWAHQYISQCDSARFNTSLKAHRVFYSVCQAIFYVIAFRSRDLTAEKEGLLFLQSLQLSSLVTSTLNPLRVCLPAVATTFAGVTRAHQLTYCHTILERNARRRLATVYSTEVQTPDECLDTFFPFDPYLLKKSAAFIEPLYLEYQASESEEKPSAEEQQRPTGRRRCDTLNDEDDFIPDKRKKVELAKSYEKDLYGVSPGFHH